MTRAHPLALDLARYADRETNADEAAAIQAHLERCPLCRVHLTRIVATADPAGGDQSDESGPPPGADTPAPVTAASPGDIRRLTWDDTSHLALIVRVDDDRVLGRPVLPWGLRDLPICHELECRFGAVDVALPVLTAGIWFRQGVVDAAVGRCLEPSYFADDIVTSDALHDWLIGHVPGADATTDLLDEFADDIDQLDIHAQWTPLTVPSPPDLDALIAAGLQPGRALDVVRGSALTDDETRRVTLATGIEPVTPIPVNVRRLLDHPRFKHRLRDHARSRGVSEALVRNELAANLRRPIAARTGDGSPLTLEQRLEELLE